jgi:methylated-DNA-[protein]-cysteine S-methyltransferase
MTDTERVATVFRTSRGWIALGRTRRGLCRATLPAAARETALEQLGPGFALVPEAADALLASAAEALREYLRGRAAALDLPLDLSGVPRFTRRALLECRKVPPGETAAYADLARRVGSPRAARAVGQAMRRNPLPLFIPCHRIVGCDGALTGFGGGTEGLAAKAELLAMEARQSPG